MPSKKEIIIIKGHELTISNRDKIYWPESRITKGEVIDYYRSIAPYILPYLKNRPENLHRHPNGITGLSFYQKNITTPLPEWIETAQIYSESNKKEMTYLVCQDEATLVYMANLGCIEINPWNSRVSQLEKPDYVVIDLDPGNVPFKEVIKAALEVRQLFEKLGIRSYCKTSGKRGLHIFVPMGGEYLYQEVREFAHVIAEFVQQALPKSTSIVRDPKKRKTCVYIDFLQNNKGQTLAAPYSIRPVPGAVVSTPLEWSEVNAKLDVTKFTIKTIHKRLEKLGDIWRPVLGKGIDLKKILNLQR